MDHPKIRSNSHSHLLLNFGDYGQEVEVAAISGNGRRILTVREVDVARVWDAETGEQVARIHARSRLLAELKVQRRIDKSPLWSSSNPPH